MKLKGFTLAEVLITLTLIGIVASLTMPALMTDVQRQQVGPALTKSIGVLETANILTTTESDWMSFRASCGGNYLNCFTLNIAPRMGASAITNIPAYTSITDGFSQANVFQANGAFQSHNNFTYYIGDLVTSGEGNNTVLEFVNVYIDVNGAGKGPNVLGRDLFVAAVDVDDGRVYAKGSNTDPSTAAGDRWNNTCAGDVANALYCAGAVIDNGGRVTYNW